MIRKKLLIGIVSLQVLFLAGMVLSGYLIERVGDTIALQTKPQPTEELIQQNSINLQFVAEEIRPENWFMTDEPKSNQVIFILLTPNEQGFYQVKAASDKKMDADDNEVILQARYSHQNSEMNHNVRFGFDRFQIETNELSLQGHNQKFKANIAVSPWGQTKVMDVELME